MTLKLSNIKKSHEIEIEGAILKYHQIPYIHRQRTVMSHVVNGVFDPFEVAVDLLGQMIYEWEGVLDDEDNPIPFTPDLVEFFDGETLLILIDQVVGPALKGIISLKRDLVEKGKKLRLNAKEEATDNLKNSKAMSEH